MSRRVRGSARRGSRGVTLTEALLVLTIVAIVAIVALPALTSGGGAKLAVATEEVADAIRFARQEAQRTRNPHGVLPSAATDQLRVFRLDASTNPPTRVFDVYHPVAKKLYTLTPEDGLGRGVGIDSTTLSFSPACNQPDALAFDEHGTPICTAPLSSRAQVAQLVLTHNGASRVVDTAQITGRVTVQ